MNNQLFERFRKSCDEFFAKKAEYFKAVKERMAENLEKKKALCEKAEALKDSTDWKATADIHVALQIVWFSFVFFLFIPPKKITRAFFNHALVTLIIQRVLNLLPHFQS